MKERIELALIGAIAGFSLWLLFEFLPDIVTAPFLLFFVLCSASVFFAVLMALVGPERPQRALLPSGALGLAAGLLGLWAARRFAHPEAFFDVAHGMLALFTMVFVAVPFAAAALEARGGWRRYARLFDAAWGIFIRYVAGWLFAGLIFVALFLSDALLKLVGIEIIDELLEIDVIRYTLIGAVFGLGVATVHELRGYVSPVLVHRLLRMLLPLLLVVVVIFIGALPFRGLSDLFGRLSTAAVLMSVAFAGITLITTALDRDDENASSLKLMVLSARAVALLLPVLVGLAIYAIWLRVADYGWTPDRVIAAYIALFLTGYALVYAITALRGAGWQDNLRQGNLYMALCVCAGSALWLTPLLNAERISAQSQLARAEAGEKPEGLPLYEMAHRWGLSGESALDEMEALDRADLSAEIEKAKGAGSLWAFKRGANDSRAETLRANLQERFITLPAGAELAPLLGEMTQATLQSLTRFCQDMKEPSCIMIMLPKGEADFEAEALIVVLQGRYVQSLVRANDGLEIRAAGAFDASGALTALSPDAIEKLRRGDFSFKPVSRTGVDLGGSILLPYN